MNEGGTYYKIKRFSAHSQYNKPSFAYDIALVKVQGKIQFNENVKPIRYTADEVPDKSTLQLSNFNGFNQKIGIIPTLNIKYGFCFSWMGSISSKIAE